jgi:ABC-2 type transport system permease protein
MITRTAAILGAEFRRLFRDPPTLAILLAIPVVQMVLFVFAAGLDVGNVPNWIGDNQIDISSPGALEPRVRTWYNPDLRSSDFLIPGLLVVVLMIVMVQQTATSLIRERDLGTADQLAVSPLHSLELIIGKLLPWAALAFAEFAVITALGMAVFGVPLRGDPLALAAGAAAFVFSGLGLGLLISALAKSVDAANVSALLVAFLPAFLLSGFTFPLDQVPFWVDWLSRIFPGRHMVTIVTEVCLKEAGFPQVWPELGALCLLAVITIGLSAVFNSRRPS